MTKKTIQMLISAAVLLFSMTAIASAATVHLSFDPDDWSVQNTTYEASDATFAVNSATNLQATLRNSHGSSAWRVSRQTNETYNFQNATLRYKWLVNGQGSYSAITTGTQAVHNFDPNGTSRSYYSTNNSWDGSEVIYSNTWIYSEIVFTETGYNYSMSYTGYGDSDFITGTGTMSETRWDTLADDYFYFSLGDNHAAGAYFILAEAYIETSGNPSVPVPSAILLLAFGITGITGISRFRRYK